MTDEQRARDYVVVVTDEYNEQTPDAYRITAYTDEEAIRQCQAFARGFKMWAEPYEPTAERPDQEEQARWYGHDDFPGDNMPYRTKMMYHDPKVGRVALSDTGYLKRLRDELRVVVLDD
jgi:hypothetical protein